MRFVVAAFAMLSSPALASCADEKTILACQIEGSAKHLILCDMGDKLVYTFGSPNAPELTISQSKQALTYLPWSGIGRSIWEVVQFENEGYIYEVHGSVDKMLTIEDPSISKSGGVAVIKDDAEIANLFCATETIAYEAFAFDDALQIEK